jgi:hypothetical protein
MRILYAIVVASGLLGLLGLVRSRRGAVRPEDLGGVSDQWRAAMRARGGVD